MTWLGLYQSSRCWLFPESIAPCHKATWPQVQMGGRPIASKIEAVAASRARMSSAVARGPKRGGAICMQLPR